MSAERAVGSLPFALGDRDRVGLAEVVEDAARLTRVDRKYLVATPVASALLRELPQSFRVLRIAGREWTSYASTYFDTDALDACRDHVQRRRRRWKVRSRLYVEDQFCRIEVKTKDGRGVTVKSVADSAVGRHGRLEGADQEFVARTLAGLDLDVAAESLRPSMEVDYRRLTLADTGAGLRVTLDWGVECRLGDGRVSLDAGYVLVETKGVARPSVADRTLVALGARPRSFSKYVSAASLLRPDLPDNDVRRLRGRALHASARTEEAMSA
jgi:hypothetical protein